MKQSGIPPREDSGTAAGAGASRGERDSAFAALSNPAFRWLWVANVVSGIGSMMHATAASWLLVTEAGAPTLVTLLQVMVSLPGRPELQGVADEAAKRLSAALTEVAAS